MGFGLGRGSARVWVARRRKRRRDRRVGREKVRRIVVEAVWYESCVLMLYCGG